MAKFIKALEVEEFSQNVGSISPYIKLWVPYMRLHESLSSEVFIEELLQEKLKAVMDVIAPNLHPRWRMFHAEMFAGYEIQVFGIRSEDLK